MQQHWTYVLNLKLSVWPSFLVYKIWGSCYRSCPADVAKHYKAWPLSGLAYTLLNLQGCPVSTQDMEGCPPLRRHATCLSYCWEPELPQTHCRWKAMLSDGMSKGMSPSSIFSFAWRLVEIPEHAPAKWLNLKFGKQTQVRPGSVLNLWQLAWKLLSTSPELMSIKCVVRVRAYAGVCTCSALAWSIHKHQDIT